MSWFKKTPKVEIMIYDKYYVSWQSLERTKNVNNSRFGSVYLYIDQWFALNDDGTTDDTRYTKWR